MWAKARSKVEASVARCLRTPPYGATRKDFVSVKLPLTRQPQPELQHYRWQLLERPDNGGTMPGKSPPFTPSSILFRPRPSPCPKAARQAPAIRGSGGGAGYCPRVRKAYCDERLSP